MYTSPAILLKEIILVDDASVDGKKSFYILWIFFFYYYFRHVRIADKLVKRAYLFATIHMYNVLFLFL